MPAASPQYQHLLDDLLYKYETASPQQLLATGITGIIFLATLIWLVRSLSSSGRSTLVTTATVPAPATKTKDGKYTRAEVAKHQYPDDCWIILKSRSDGKYTVYDVTPYVEEHPGGGAILNNAGKDSTKGFFGPQHPDRVFDLIEDFKIGTLAED